MTKTVPVTVVHHDFFIRKFILKLELSLTNEIPRESSALKAHKIIQ